MTRIVELIVSQPLPTFTIIDKILAMIEEVTKPQIGKEFESLGQDDLTDQSMSAQTMFSPHWPGYSS